MAAQINVSPIFMAIICRYFLQNTGKEWKGSKSPLCAKDI